MICNNSAYLGLYLFSFFRFIKAFIGAKPTFWECCFLLFFFWNGQHYSLYIALAFMINTLMILRCVNTCHVV